MQRLLSRSNWWISSLPIMLILGGAAMTAVALAADLLGIGGPQGLGPRQAALGLSGLAVLLAGVVPISPVSRRHIGEWLVVVLASIAVAFAADLIVINGLPELAAKHLVLASVVFCILLIGTISVAPPSTREGSSWPGLFSLENLNISQFLSTAVQLGFLVLAIRLFRLENQAIYHNLMLISFYGFVIHYLLPTQYRLPFFLLLSLGAFAGILGFLNGVWLVGIGLALIGICHLPISYSARVAILLATGGAMVALRAGWIRSSSLDVIWPVLASIFMFRLIIYMYDLKHGKSTPTFTSTLSYFFLLPNVVFPFFPVVDYSTFRRTYYNEDQHQIYQKGVQWIFRGVIQLILYRYINYYVMIGPGDVTSTLELVRYLIANFALYLRISGQFHMIIGVLHLFGFNLPETHHFYFMASSFTDLWRRINIYWKDFMLKVFYYPTYFKIRHWGPSASLVAATAFVFFLTWFFHAYQWFWLRGTFLFTTPDMLFWFILACLVVVNTLYETSRGRKRTLGQRSMTARDIAALALRTASTYTVMAVLWSLWSSDSIPDWIALMSVVELNAADITALILVFLIITLAFGLTIWIGMLAGKPTQPDGKQPTSRKSSAVTAGAILLLFLIGNPVIYKQFGGEAQALISNLTMNRLSDREAALLQRGYYEDLIGVNRFNSQLWEIYSKRPSDWVSLRDTAAIRPTNDNLIMELVPSTSIDFNGTQLATNRWGMRDHDYEQIPPPDTYRIALTGPSFVMGYGVGDNEGFDPLLEDRLNQDHAGNPFATYEILNFAVPGYSAIQNLIVLEQKIARFQPNTLFYMAHQREEQAAILYLADRISAGAELPYSDLIETARQAGADEAATKAENERRLQPVGNKILGQTYRRIVETARAQGMLPVWIFMPTLEDPLHEEEITYLTALAQESGFIVLDLSDAYEGQNPDAIVVAYWDKHPNAEGHRLIAEDLYRKLQEHQEEIPLFH